MSKIARVLTFLLALSLVLSIISPWINPEVIFIFNAFAVVHPWLLLMNILVLILLLLLKSKSYWIPLIAIGLSLPGISEYFQVSSFAQAESEEVSLLSYNVGGLYYKDEKGMDQFISSLEESRVKILALQECSLNLRNKIFHSKLYPHVHENARKGPVLFSKYKIIDSGEIPLSSRVNACIWVDIIAEGKKLRLYNVHLRSSHISHDANELISGKLESNKEAVGQGQRILKKFLSSSKVRAREAKKIVDHASSLEYPSIIMGDLNETAKSYVYKLLSKGRQDSFVERGNWTGVSYRGKIPGLRIDFVFLPKGSKVLKHELFHWDYSDHAPVYTEFEWRQEDE